MAARAALIDAFGQVAHTGDFGADFLAQQQTAGAGFAPCPTTTSIASARITSCGLKP
jgi:hypothetical protein